MKASNSDHGNNDILSDREAADVIAAVGEVSYGWRRHIVTPCRPTDTRDAAFGEAWCGRVHACFFNTRPYTFLV